MLVDLICNLRYQVGFMSHGSSLSTGTSYIVDDQGSIPGRDREFPLCHHVHIGSGAYPLGTRGHFPGDKVAML